MKASTPALEAIWPTRFRYAREVPRLNQLRCAAPDHVARRVRPWSTNDPRHHGGVCHAQPIDAVHAQLGIYDRERVCADPACPYGVSKARRTQSSKFTDILSGRLGPGNDLAFAHTVEGMLAPQFTRDLDGSDDCREITIRGEVVCIDLRRIFKAVTAQTDRPSARRLHEPGRDGERVGRRSSKARRRVGCQRWQLLEHEYSVEVGVTGATSRQVHFGLDRIAVGGPIRHPDLVLAYDSGHEHMVLKVFPHSWQVLHDGHSNTTE